MHFADVDGDTDLDLITDPEGLYLNDGAGNFTDQSSTWLPPGLPVSGFFGPHSQVETADFNGDGRPDVLFSGDVLENTGSSFVNRTNLWYARGSSLLVPVAGDVDLDGDVDLMRVDAMQVQLFRNDGTGNMTASAAAAPFSEFSGIGPLFDADGDDDLDLMAFGGSARHLLSNLHRHLHSEVSLEPGQVYNLDVYARPDYPTGDLAIIGISLGGLTTPIPFPQGNHWLDISQEVLLSITPVPTGKATVSFLVPPFSDLQGLEVFFQGWLVAVDDRFTNVVRDRVRF